MAIFSITKTKEIDGGVEGWKSSVNMGIFGQKSFRAIAFYVGKPTTFSPENEVGWKL